MPGAALGYNNPALLRGLLKNKIFSHNCARSAKKTTWTRIYAKNIKINRRRIL